MAAIVWIRGLRSQLRIAWWGSFSLRQPSDPTRRHRFAAIDDAFETLGLLEVDRVYHVLPPENGWIEVACDDYFTDGETVNRHVSASLHTVVSQVGIYDSDTWQHVLWSGGTELTRFDPFPDMFGRGSTDVAGSPPWLPPPSGSMPTASKGISVRFRGRGAAEEARNVKAYPDDERDLGSDWVFADLWRMEHVAEWSSLSGASR